MRGGVACGSGHVTPVDGGAGFPRDHPPRGLWGRPWPVIGGARAGEALEEVLSLGFAPGRPSFALFALLLQEVQAGFGILDAVIAGSRPFWISLPRYLCASHLSDDGEAAHADGKRIDVSMMKGCASCMAFRSESREWPRRMVLGWRMSRSRSWMSSEGRRDGVKHLFGNARKPGHVVNDGLVWLDQLIEDDFSVPRNKTDSCKRELAFPSRTSRSPTPRLLGLQYAACLDL